MQSTQAPQSRCQSAVTADVSSPVTQKAFNTIDTAELFKRSAFNITLVQKLFHLQTSASTKPE